MWHTQVIHDICSKMALQYNSGGLPWPWSWLRLMLLPPAYEDTSRDTPSTADAYAKIRQTSNKPSNGKGAAALWQLLFGGNEGVSGGDTIKAGAGQIRSRAHHKAKPLVTAAA